MSAPATDNEALHFFKEFKEVHGVCYIYRCCKCDAELRLHTDKSSYTKDYSVWLTAENRCVKRKGKNA